MQTFYNRCLEETTVTNGLTACNPFTTASFTSPAVQSMLLSEAPSLKNGGRRKQDIQVYWESRPVSRLEGDPLKGIVQTGYSALFPPPQNISSETTDLAGSRLAGIYFVQMHTHTHTHTLKTNPSVN